MIILCLNGGSSSLKADVFAAEAGAEPRRVASAAVERIGLEGTALKLRDGEGRRAAEEAVEAADQSGALAALMRGLGPYLPARPVAVGHRIVHGGPDHADPALVDEGLLADLRRLTAYAPLHLPGEVALIEAVSAHLPGVPQVACFDTAFHRAMPELAKRLPLPRDLYDKGVRRYGFHGLSYEYIVSTLGPGIPRRVVIAHLGNGSSLAAVLDGRALDTTMGLTPCGGVPSGTRTGDLDPGVLFHLMGPLGLSAAEAERLVNFESGLLGVSGSSSDMKTLGDRAPTDLAAAQAIAIFAYSVRKTIGAFAAALGGIDLLVFTGGIGERGLGARAAICEGLGFLGIDLDPASNASPAGPIGVEGSRCEVRVIPTDESLVIARHTLRWIDAVPESSR